MTELNVDVCVIGAGSGGLSVAAGAVQMGASVVLIEGHKMGGDCLNYGCVPSKALLHASRSGMSYADAIAHVRSTIETIEPHDSEDRFEGLGCTVIRDWARFASPNIVQAGETRVRARRFVVATGSSPVVPPIDGIDSVTAYTNETIFDLPEKPEHLIIIGGGPIGMEMAQAHRGLGCDVTVIEAAQALGREDADARAVVVKSLRDQWITVHEGTAVERISNENGVTVYTSNGAITGSHLLVAAGRKVNIDRLNLRDANVAHTAKGITVGDDLRSMSNKKVYAIGDVAGGMQFTHLAGYHAGVIIRSMLLALPAKAKTHHIPRVTYTAPELAQIGPTEDEARKEYGSKVTVARAEYTGSDRAIATGHTTGFIKVMVVKGRPVGVTIVGPDAGELIAMWSMAIANNLKLSAISNTVLPYPTMAEINKRAASAYFTPKLFENPNVKRVVGLVQRFLP
ncbi:dihydrolipoamide dehydrogenase [Marivivens niveibacter]|uniref:Dihydrolipoamide dehydrogenase n=1 Tax=Marivivens niveibacter TaxID=1930667 RepID=A0A251WYB8_9RHOB|nr:FAD-dependent oxidoreductase [Marivivens niveibacter]OUD09372.1 dihydrolipoamide dehydrogenase [Marivivens niveibacter]